MESTEKSEDNPRPEPQVEPPRKHATKEFAEYCVLPVDHPLRLAAAQLYYSFVYEWLVLAFVIVGCILLIIDVPNVDNTSWILFVANILLLIVWIIELGIEVLNEGIGPQRPYLRYGCRVVNTIILCAGLIELPFGLYLVWLRCVRPLRLITAALNFEGLREHIIELVHAARTIGGIACPVLMYWLVYALIGKELYGGTLRWQCLPDTSLMSLNHVDQELINLPLPSVCVPPDDNLTGNCPHGGRCLETSFAGPNNGATSFDNTILSLLLVFQCSTLEGWTNILYYVNEGTGHTWNWLFFVPLITIGSYLMLTLATNVFSSEYAKERERLENRKCFAALRRQQFEEQEAEEKEKRLTQSGQKVEKPEDSSPEPTVIDKLRKQLANFFETRLYFVTRSLLILIQAIVTATVHQDQPEWLSVLQVTIECVFLPIFLIEMLLKMMALGWKSYLESIAGIIELIVNAICVFELIYGVASGRGTLGLHIIRTIQLLSLLKFTSFSIRMENLITSLLNSTSTIISLIEILALINTLFALIGLHMFGGRFGTPTERPYFHFDTFPNAFITVFQVLTKEDWHVVMHYTVGVMGGGQSIGLIFALYFLAILLVGNFIVLNVTITMAVDNLATSIEMTAAIEAEEMNQDVPEKGGEAEPKTTVPLPPPLPEPPTESTYPEKSGNENSFLHPLQTLIGHAAFNPTMAVIILISIVVMAIENVVNRKAQINKLTLTLDWILVVIFSAECIGKIITNGLIGHEGAYLYSGYNILDLMVTSVQITCQCLKTIGCCGSADYAFINTINAFRALRLIRIPSLINGHYPQLLSTCKQIFTALKNTVPVIILYLVFQFVFAVIGVSAYKDVPSPEDSIVEANCSRFNDTCNTTSRFNHLNFNNVADAFLALFAVTTEEAWPILRQASLRGGTDGGTIWMNLGTIIFYISYHLIMPFFNVAIFVSHVIIVFAESANESDVEENYDRNQIDNMECCIKAAPINLHKPVDEKSWKYKLWVLIRNDRYRWTTTILVIVNTIVLILSVGAWFHDQPMWMNYLQFAIEVTLTIAFLADFGLKVALYGVMVYLESVWNLLDVVCLLANIFEIIFFVINVAPPLLSLLRCFRVIRIIRLIEHQQIIRDLIGAFGRSLKSVMNILLVVSLTFLLYAVIGMQIFGSVELGPRTHYNRHNHFRTVFSALLLLFRCVTGEKWQLIMLSVIPGSACDESLMTDTTCGNVLSVPYFVSFVFLTRFMLIKLFVATVMDKFDFLTRDSSILSVHHLSQYTEAWSHFDPNGTGLIHHSKLLELIRRIQPPLGLGCLCTKEIALPLLMRLRCDMDLEGNVEFASIMLALIRQRLYIKQFVDEEVGETQADVDASLREDLKEVFPAHAKHIDDIIFVRNADNMNVLTVAEIYAGEFLVRWRRNHLKLKSISG